MSDSQSPSAAFEVLTSVRERYALGAQSQTPELCCPVDYDASLLAVLPAEIIERDYGCGDPSRFVRPGDTVLDLGSGAGKICYMASQLAGSGGRVIGVDATPEMLDLARRHREAIGDAIGWQNVEFRRGHIQDLSLDLDQVEAWLAAHPVRDTSELEALRAEEARLRRESPLIADDSIDLVLSNCVLNLVDPAHKPRLFSEIERVLRRGGRAAISDIVCDEDVPEELMRDPELWSGCISGALREDRFVQAFADAGLFGVEVVERQSEPWAVVEGLEFRSMTVVAWKGKQGPCRDHREAVVYKGPWKQVVDDDGHVLERGARTAVCRKTFEIYTREPYADQICAVPPLVPVSAADGGEFDCLQGAQRDPRETKHGVLRDDVAPGGLELRAGFGLLLGLNVRHDPDELRERLRGACVYLLFTPGVCGAREPLAVLESLLPHVDLIQVRVKAQATAPSVASELFEWTERVLDLCRAHGAAAPPVLVNDRVDVARALSERGCAGVHLGQDDAPPTVAREVLGAHALIGLSTHSAAQVARAEDEPVDYLGFGPLHATATKGYTRGLGCEAAWIAASASHRPLFPIGGIHAGNAGELEDIGRAAVSAALLAADEPARAARELRAQLCREPQGK